MHVSTRETTPLRASSVSSGTLATLDCRFEVGVESKINDGGEGRSEGSTRPAECTEGQQ